MSGSRFSSIFPLSDLGIDGRKCTPSGTMYSGNDCFRNSRTLARLRSDRR